MHSRLIATRYKTQKVCSHASWVKPEVLETQTGPHFLSLPSVVMRGLQQEEEQLVVWYFKENIWRYWLGIQTGS
jgi:hypothetical protein